MVEITEHKNVQRKLQVDWKDLPKNDSRWNYAYRDPSFLLNEQEKRKQVGIRTKVHRRSFWGIQTVDEYESVKRRKLEADFKGKSIEEILSLLEEHPVHVVALPLHSQNQDLWHEIDPKEKYALTVLDGHHRIRFAPKVIKEIPAIIFTVEEAFEAYKKRYKGTIDDFVHQITTERDEALRSFTRIRDSFLPDYVRVVREETGQWRVGY